MSLKRTTDPANPALSVANAKTHCRVTGSDDDTEITAYISAATDYVEAATGRQLVNGTYTLKLDTFPAEDYIELPRPPLSSVTSVKYYDTAGVQQTFSSDDYTVDTHSEPGRVVLNYGESWPNTRTQHQAVEIVFVAGYGADDTSVPENLQTAIRLLVGDFFENRESTTPITLQTTKAVENLLRSSSWGRYP